MRMGKLGDRSEDMTNAFDDSKQPHTLELLLFNATTYTQQLMWPRTATMHVFGG